MDGRDARSYSMKRLHQAADTPSANCALFAFMNSSRSLRRMAILKPSLLLCIYSILQIWAPLTQKIDLARHSHLFLLAQGTRRFTNANQICEVDYNNSMEAAIDKEHGRNESQGRNASNADTPNQYSKTTPALERKISKRREAQEERNVVLDLFKELIGKVNEGYSKIIAAQNNKSLPIRPSKPSKSKQKVKPKEIIFKESKERARKSSSEEVEPTFERKEQIWNNYSKLMAYEILIEQSQPQHQAEPTPLPTAQSSDLQ